MLRSLLITLSILTTLSCLAQQEQAASRMAPGLKALLSRKSKTDSISISLSLNKAEDIAKIKGLMNLRQAVKGFPVYIGKIRISDLEALEAQKEVVLIAPYLSPKEELTTGATDLTLNGIYYLLSVHPELTGDSLNAIIKERLFDTTDIDLRWRVIKTGYEATDQTAHASEMATIIAGAGNSSSFARGSARKAKLGSASFLNLFPEPDSLVQHLNISVENHSYGTAVENFYGNEAMAYDLQSTRLNHLMLVFSAGNSGDQSPSTGLYAGLPSTANLTGNYKQAKNIIAVGSVDSAGQLMPLSSKGPAYDGRIKPELMAYGEDGSSGAAALVSGVALLVQHAYKLQHDSLPSASLVKAALLNSADDLGKPHPDYASGFGNLNAAKAVETITANHFGGGSVVQGATRNISITVPSGLSRLRVMLVWTDAAAPINAAKALVNNLDLVVSNQAGANSWLPWTLDPTANAPALQAMAQRKKDTLNNVEQVTIDDPQPGAYVIEVSGSSVTNSQGFSIVWQFDTTGSFNWTYPTRNDPLLAGNTHWLRWETEMQSAGQIEYATNGNNWRPVGTASDLSRKYFKWQVPDTVTKAIFRMKLASGAFIYSDSFAISPMPRLEAGFHCADSFLLHWNAIAPAYRVYELNGAFLQPFLETTDTAIVLHQAQHPSNYFSVAPLAGNKEGVRSLTLNYQAAGNDCYLRSFYLQSQTASQAFFFAELGSLYQVAEVSFEKFTANGYVSLQTIQHPTLTGFNFTDSSLNQGENLYRVRIRLNNGALIYSNVERVYQLGALQVLVYPNPVGQSSTIKILSGEAGRYQIRIVDMNGRLMYQQDLNSSLVLVDAAHFAKGLYVLRVEDKQGKSFSQKLVVY